MQIDNESLIELSYDIDDRLMEYCLKYEIPPLQLTSIILARLTHLNESANMKQKFGELITVLGHDLINGKYNKETKSTIQ